MITFIKKKKNTKIKICLKKLNIFHITLCVAVKKVQNCFSRIELVRK